MNAKIIAIVAIVLALLVGTACGSAQGSGEVVKSSPALASASTLGPTATPTQTNSPTPVVTVTPTPTVAATTVPTQAPTTAPTVAPTLAPTVAPTAALSQSSIGVVLTDAATGKPIANANVAVIPADQCQAPNLSDVPGGKYFMTDAAGHGTTGNVLPAGTYKMQVQAAGYQRQWWKQQAGCGNATSLTVTGSKGGFAYEIALIKN